MIVESFLDEFRCGVCDDYVEKGSEHEAGAHKACAQKVRLRLLALLKWIERYSQRRALGFRDSAARASVDVDILLLDHWELPYSDQSVDDIRRM